MPDFMCEFVGGKYNGWQVPVSYVRAHLGNGRLTEDLSAVRARGGVVHRAELDNQPKVDGYLGPMWDGGHLRYETQEIYNMLST